MMIFITGDTHCPIDIRKLNTSNFKEQQSLTKNDFLIITGDCGIVWDNSSEEKYWQNWLNAKNFTTLFVDGNHENFDLLNSYTVSEWNGGKVHFIKNSVIHLMRGQVYTINDKKFFVMGGAESIDKILRKEGKSWWKEELPSEEEYEEALNNLDKHNWTVDYVITHTSAPDAASKIAKYDTNNKLNSFFRMIEKYLNYKHWYFGHFHVDIKIDDKHTALYNKIIRIM